MLGCLMLIYLVCCFVMWMWYLWWCLLLVSMCICICRLWLFGCSCMGDIVGSFVSMLWWCICIWFSIGIGLVWGVCSVVIFISIVLLVVFSGSSRWWLVCSIWLLCIVVVGRLLVGVSMCGVVLLWFSCSSLCVVVVYSLLLVLWVNLCMGFVLGLSGCCVLVMRWLFC